MGRNYIDNILNNEFIEDNVMWNADDNYYGQSDDATLSEYINQNCDNPRGIKNIVFSFYQKLCARYHNNFYITDIITCDDVRFLIRGQPIFDDNPLDLIVKYTLIFLNNNLKIDVLYVKKDDVSFEIEQEHVKNYMEPKGFFGRFKKVNVVDNSNDILEYLNNLDMTIYFDKSDESEIRSDTILAQSTSSNNVLDMTSEYFNEDISIINEEYVIYCHECGSKNYPLNQLCKNCGNVLVSYKVNDGLEINSFDYLLSEDCKKKIKYADIDEETYHMLTDTIMHKVDKINYSNDNDIYDEILHICTYYVNVILSDSMDSFGYFSAKTIMLNSSYSKALKSASLIKYLSREIFSEILEHLTMYILGVKSNNYIKSLVNYSLSSSFLNEAIIMYMSIRVESFFIPKQYHNYEEIEALYSQGISETGRGIMLLFGNSLANEVIKILSPIIDVKLRAQLHKQFIVDNEDTTNDIRRFEFDDSVNFVELMDIYKAFLEDSIDEASGSSDELSELTEIKKYLDESMPVQ